MNARIVVHVYVCFRSNGEEKIFTGASVKGKTQDSQNLFGGTLLKQKDGANGAKTKTWIGNGCTLNLNKNQRRLNTLSSRNDYICPFCHTELTPSKNNGINSEFWSCEKCRHKDSNLWHWYLGFGNLENSRTVKHWEVHFESRKLNDPEFGWRLCDSTNTPLVRERFVLS